MVAGRGYTPDRGDLVWLDFNPQAGREQAGRRPALILSARAYNAASGLAIACPITSRVKGYPFEVALPPGGRIAGVALADHLRSIDWRERNAQLIGRARPDFVDLVAAYVHRLIDRDS